jgi:hypothetical protein
MGERYSLSGSEEYERLSTAYRFVPLDKGSGNVSVLKNTEPVKLARAPLNVEPDVRRVFTPH